MNYQLEVIGFNIESCIAAQEAGAHRIELCANPGEGGTTPSHAFILEARSKLHIDLFVMIRPRGGDFLYSDEDFEIMKKEVLLCKEAGVDGIVTGILTSDGKIDKKRNQELVDLAYPMYATFHRAFDRVSSATEALEDIIDLGFERILTSGLHPKAMDGKETLASLVKQAGGRIIIMPGSGVHSKNLIEIAEITGAQDFHSSASIIKESEMNYSNPLMKEKLTYIIVNKKEVAAMAAALQSLENRGN